MRTIDADYLQNVLDGWQKKYDENSAEYRIIAEFKYCINVQKTVLDIQGIINDIQNERLDYEGLSKQDITSAVLYNDGLEYAIRMVKNNINPDLRDNFSFRKEDNQNEKNHNNQEK